MNRRKEVTEDEDFEDDQQVQGQEASVPENDKSESIEENASDASDSDSDEELILFARISKGIQSAQPTTGQASRADKRLQTKQEKQRAEERARMVQERLEQKKSREKQQRKSKAEKRHAFTLENLRVADSHVFSQVAMDEKDVENSANVSTDLKALLKEAYGLIDEKKSKEAIPVLKRAVELALSQNNLLAAMSASTLLGNESLKIELTRDAIESFHRALQLSKDIPSVTPEQKISLVAALQGAYKNVGDMESAAYVVELYGIGSARPTQVLSLPSGIQGALSSAIQSAIVNKDLNSLRMLLASFSKSEFATAVAKYSLPGVGVTALHAASGRNDPELVRSLVSMGADPHAKDGSGSTPLIWAARFNGVNALDELFKCGARFSEDLDQKEIAGWTPEVKQRIEALIASSSG